MSVRCCQACGSSDIVVTDDFERDLKILKCRACGEMFAVSNRNIYDNGESWVFDEWANSLAQPKEALREEGEAMSDTFQYREEIDLQKMVDEQARELQRRVDEATLDKAADKLAEFGYVKADGKSRWHELFGTPERAAVTLVRTSDERAVCKLPTWTASSNDYEAWLEWLREDCAYHG